MTILKHDPYKDLIDLQEKMHRLLLDAFRHSDEKDESAGAWSPPMDVYETQEAIIIVAELPGIASDDLDIRIGGGSIILQGERSFGKSLKEENYLRIERHYGKFSRSMAIPPTINVDEVQAVYRNGVLEIKLPKTENSQSKSRRVLID